MKMISTEKMVAAFYLAVALIFALVAGYVVRSGRSSEPAAPPDAGAFRAADGFRELFWLGPDGELVVGGDVTARDVACAWARERGTRAKGCP